MLLLLLLGVGTEVLGLLFVGLMLVRRTSSLTDYFVYLLPFLLVAIWRSLRMSLCRSACLFIGSCKVR